MHNLYSVCGIIVFLEPFFTGLGGWGGVGGGGVGSWAWGREGVAEKERCGKLLALQGGTNVEDSQVYK